MTPDQEALISNVSLVVMLLRTHKGWTQQQLADNAGISRATLAFIESAKIDVRVLTLKKLCEALGINLQTLFTYEIPDMSLRKMKKIAEEYSNVPPMELLRVAEAK